MLNPDFIDEEVLTDILYGLGYSDEEPGNVGEDYNQCIEMVENLSVFDAFDRFLNWNGIIGYTSTIIKALDSIRAAQK